MHRHYKDGDTLTDAIEEGSHLKANSYKYTEGTGKYKGVTGGGTYTYENVSDTMAAGKYSGEMVLP